MSNKEISPKEWEKLIKTFIKEATSRLANKRGEASKLADKLDLTRGAISSMIAGRTSGSAPVAFRMLFILAGFTDDQAREILKDPKQLLQKLESTSIDKLDELYFDLKSKYSENELAAWLRLLDSKLRVEESLGLSVKASLAKSSKKKKT